jgi:hypothetical protein
LTPVKLALASFVAGENTDPTKYFGGV